MCFFFSADALQPARLCGCGAGSSFFLFLKGVLKSLRLIQIFQPFTGGHRTRREHQSGHAGYAVSANRWRRLPGPNSAIDSNINSMQFDTIRFNSSCLWPGLRGAGREGPEESCGSTGREEHAWQGAWPRPLPGDPDSFTPFRPYLAHSSPVFLVFCAFSPSRRGGSNEPKTGAQGQETAGTGVQTAENTVSPG